MRIGRFTIVHRGSRLHAIADGENAFACGKPDLAQRANATRPQWCPKCRAATRASAES